MHMPNTKSLGRCALVALIVSLSATVPLGQEAAAQGRPSNPVIVTNPNTNPAITSDIENRGRAPYQSSVRTESCGGRELCEFSFAAPAGKRIVVQNVAGFVFFGGAGGTTVNQIQVSVFALPTRNIMTGFALPAIRSGQAFAEQTLFYIDPGQSVIVDVILFGESPVFTNNPQVVTLAGYAVDCTVAGCPDIVH